MGTISCDFLLWVSDKNRQLRLEIFYSYSHDFWSKSILAHHRIDFRVLNESKRPKLGTTKIDKKWELSENQSQSSALRALQLQLPVPIVLPFSIDRGCNCHLPPSRSHPVLQCYQISTQLSQFLYLTIYGSFEKKCGSFIFMEIVVEFRKPITKVTLSCF